MFLIFDTETTTFPSKSLPVTSFNQARIVQLAWLLLDNDFKEVACFNNLIKLEEGYYISEGAQKAHGISKEDCEQYGISIDCAFECFANIYEHSNIVIAHNINFDSQLIDIESQLLTGLTGIFNWADTTRHKCTMLEMTPICKLPGSRFGNQYKWPKLIEAHRFCFNEDFQHAHDALADVRATARVFQWLVNNQHITI